jgi:hypothetical protein
VRLTRELGSASPLAFPHWLKVDTGGRNGEKAA